MNGASDDPAHGSTAERAAAAQLFRAIGQTGSTPPAQHPPSAAKAHFQQLASAVTGFTFGHSSFVDSGSIKCAASFELSASPAAC